VEKRKDLEDGGQDRAFIMWWKEEIICRMVDRIGRL
jgi:hypothetical protein